MSYEVKTKSKKEFWNIGSLKKEIVFIVGTDLSIERRYFSHGWKEELPMINKKANGIVTEWNSFGQIMSEIHYIDNIKHGKSVSYWNNGILLKKENFVKGVLDGIVEFWWESGDRSIIAHSKGEESHGISISFNY